MKKLATHHEFNAIYIVESLASSDLKTGTMLYSGTIEPMCSSISGFHAVLRTAATKAEFFGCLADLRELCASPNYYPILHIEAHGDEHSTGYVLSSGELVEWGELRQHCQAISERTKFNLVVVSASCAGGHLIKSMKPTEIAPFWAVVGPKADVDDVDLLAGLEAFYRVLLGTEDGDAALRALTESSEASEGDYQFFTAETFFCWIFEKYETTAAEQQLEQRVSDCVEEWAAGKLYDLKATERIRKQARELILDHRRWYDYLRTRFLMLDKFPENKGRFSVSYDDCRGNSASGLIAEK